MFQQLIASIAINAAAPDAVKLSFEDRQAMLRATTPNDLLDAACIAYNEARDWDVSDRDWDVSDTSSEDLHDLLSVMVMMAQHPQDDYAVDSAKVEGFIQVVELIAHHPEVNLKELRMQCSDFIYG